MDPTVYSIDILYTSEEGEDCEVSLSVGDTSLPLSPNTTTSDLQDMLDSVTAIQDVGGVRVQREVELTEDGYYRVKLRLIFLTTQIENIPTITVSSTPDNCTQIAHGVSQPPDTPTFKLRYPDSTRQTRPLSVAMTTAAELQTELETLLSYECTRNSPPNVS